MNQIVTGFKGPNVLHIMGFIQFRISAWQRIELRNSGMKGRAWAFPGQPYALGLSIFTWAFPDDLKKKRITKLRISMILR